MITAAQARQLAGPTLMEKVEALEEAIKRQASLKNRKLRTGWDYTADSDLWINGGYSGTKEWKDAKKILEDLGYKVTFYYSEGSIAVDMYTVIEW